MAAETHEVVVADLTHDGLGVASVGGERVFIPDVLPEETVSITLGKRRRKLRHGQLEAVIAPSPMRVEPGCEYFGRCGGCGLQHLDLEAQLDWKGKATLETLRRIGSVVPGRVGTAITSRPWGYRRRARVGIKYVARKGRVLAGFRERGASFITDMRRCPVLVSPFDECLGDLADTIGGSSVRADVPQAELAAGDGHGAIVLRLLSAPARPDLDLLDAFGRRWDLDIYLQTGGLDSVAPLNPERARPLFYEHHDLNINLRFTPTDFIQVNGAVNRAMVARAIQLLQPSKTDRALDLFSGLGNFTLPLARHAGEVLGLEGAAGLVARAGENAARNGIDNASFRIADLADPKALPTGPFDLILLDPPRTGAAALVPHFAPLKPRRVLYVSCHPGTLARDAAVLSSQGFGLAEVIAVDMFPHTQHVETMALFVA